MLDPSFEKWLGNFATLFVAENPNVKATNAAIIAALDKQAKNEAIKGMNGRDFLRSLVLKMLHYRCSRGDSRLLQLIKSVIKHAVPPLK